MRCLPGPSLKNSSFLPTNPGNPPTSDAGRSNRFGTQTRRLALLAMPTILRIRHDDHFHWLSFLVCDVTAVERSTKKVQPWQWLPRLNK